MGGCLLFVLLFLPNLHRALLIPYAPMRTRVNRSFYWRVLLLLLVASPAAAQQEDAAPAMADDRWIPSLAVTSGITVQGMESSVASSCRDGGGEPTDPSDVRIACSFAPTASGSRWARCE